jgi:hypothetical protein
MAKLNGETLPKGARNLHRYSRGT